jgi:hypothetical protein
MATKVIIEIQGNMYDFWECRSLERDVRYNEETEQLEYLLVMNRQAIATNYTTVEFPYPTEELRETEYKSIKEQMDEYEGVIFINGGSSVKDLKKTMAALKHTNTEDEE